MHNRQPAAVNLQKLCMMALYTSPIIAALLITPLYVVSYQPAGYFVSLFWTAVLVLVLWCYNILIVYVRRNKPNPNNWQKYFLSYFFGVVINAISVQFAFQSFFHAGKWHNGTFFHFHVIVFLSINTVILVLENLLLLQHKNTAIERENMQLRIKNMEAANQQLKHQIQPHFLFNSLSTLKALIKTSPQNAEDYLVKLSGFLRYSVSAGHLNTVKVSDELSLCTDYLEMQKIRFGEALQFAIQVPQDVQDNKYLPVFALQVLAENAVKHNSFTVSAPLFISITYANGFISLENNLQRIISEGGIAGTGLANLNERYKLLAGEGIIVTESDATFTVSIKTLE